MSVPFHLKVRLYDYIVPGRGVGLRVIMADEIYCCCKILRYHRPTKENFGFVHAVVGLQWPE